MKDLAKGIVKQKLHYPLFFYRYLRYRLVWVVLICILIGVLDGLGLTMFLPLLQISDGATPVNSSNYGNLKFLFDIFSYLNIQLSLTVILTFLCVFFIGKGIIIYLGNAYRVNVQQYFVKTIRFKTLSLINQSTYVKFLELNVGRIQNTLTGEVARLSMALTSYLFALQNLILVLVYVCFAIIINPQFSIIVAVGGFISNIFFRRIYKATQNASKNLTNETHLYQGLIIQFVTSFKYLKATATTDGISKKLTNQILEIEKNNKKIGLLSSIMSAVREPVMIVVVALAIWFQTKIMGGELSSILVSLLFFYRSLSSLMTLQTQYNSFLTVSGSMDNMSDFIRSLVQAPISIKKQNYQGNIGGIELKNVRLSFSDTEILHGINLNIRKNETLAFVGESGSGKTTLVNLISGLYSVSSGEILISGENIENIELKTYQSKIGYITQEPIIFNASLYDNITLWAEKTPENIARFEMVIKQAAIDKFILSQSEGSDSFIAINGSNLSGGQKQRISIARELYKNLDLLIMDEATSALDTETEKEIQDNIDKLKGQFTILIVAHRLSTIKNADRIVLMKKGKIEAVGTYTELMEFSDYFRRMVQLQELN